MNHSRLLDLELASRLRAAHATTDGNGCWVWRARASHGYGVVTVGGQNGQLAHRVMYELSVGPIASGLTLDHLCQNRPCANPSHLEPVTQAENVRRYYAGRPARSECRNGHKLTADTTFVIAGVVRCSICRRKTIRAYQVAKRRKNWDELGISPGQRKVYKVNCKHGHPLSGDNLLIDSTGYRQCRTCRRDRDRSRRQRRRVAA